MFRLAQLTDLHVRGFRGATARQFWSKRAIGTLNLLVSRVRKHRMELLALLRADLCRQAPDHLAVTGDLSNIALVGEWLAARTWIEETGLPPKAMTVIPGNHDTYTSDVVESGEFEQIFAAYMTSDLDRSSEYPFVQFRGDLAIVGVNTAVATGDFGAWGKIGEAQLARLEALLASDKLKGRLRVVLVHHPPVRHKRGEQHNLRDRSDFAAVLARAGAELVLHGHDHEDERATLAGPGGTKIPVIGAGSASFATNDDRRSRYNLFEIDGATITWITRAHNQTTGDFHEVRRERL